MVLKTLFAHLCGVSVGCVGVGGVELIFQDLLYFQVETKEGPPQVLNCLFLNLVMSDMTMMTIMRLIKVRMMMMTMKTMMVVHEGEGNSSKHFTRDSPSH